MYKFSVCDWKLPIPGMTSFFLAAELGFDGIQILDFGGESRGFPLCISWIQDHLKRVMEKTGVMIDTLQPNNIIETGQVASHPNSSLGKQGLNGVRKAAEACEVLGIPRIQLESMDTAHINHIQTTEDIDNAAAFLRASAEILGEAGVRLTYESFAPIDETMELYEKSGRCFKLCYDTMNPISFGFGDPVDELPYYLNEDMVDFIHFKDTPPDGYLGTAKMGEGTGRFYECAKIIRRFGYQGWLVTENHYGLMGVHQDPVEAMKQDLKTMQDLFRVDNT